MKYRKDVLVVKIIIVGNGKVGSSLAEQLVREAHDVTVVDTRDESLRHIADILDIMSVTGNAVSPVILREAGAADADMLIAATNSDEVNMVCCLVAKNLGTAYTIARVRNSEYNDILPELQQNLKIDNIINPESAAAVEIARLLRFPSAANIETFCRGRVELMSLRLQAGDFLLGKPLYALSDQIKNLSLLFCAVERQGGIIIPNGFFVPEIGDKMYLVGRPDSLDRFFHILGRYTPRVRQVFIIGGGKITMYLADILNRMGVHLKIVERDPQICRQIHMQFPRAMVICGDGTEQEILDSENLTSCDAFVALTDHDEDNFIISLYAMQQQVPKVILKSNRANYAGIARQVGLDSVVSLKEITASYILRLVRGMHNSQGSVMNALYRIANGGAEAMEFAVGADTRHLGVPLKDLRLRDGILLAVIVRGQEIIIPRGSSYLQQGDDVIIITRGGVLTELNDIYDESGTVARMTGGVR